MDGRDVPFHCRRGERGEVAQLTLEATLVLVYRSETEKELVS